MRRLSAKDVPVRTVVMRGGTTRGVFFHERDLPRAQPERDRLILAAIGAPDPRQVDGLGGADLLLSKAAIVAPAERPDADVECTFASVAPGQAVPYYGANCGNLVSAVAVFAIEEGLVPQREVEAPVRIHNTNSDSFVHAHVGNGTQLSDEACRLAGMAASGVRVELDFLRPVGTVQDRLLPTGQAQDVVVLTDRRPVSISIVDAGALYVFVRAEDLGLTGRETSAEVQNRPGLLEALEMIRGSAAVMVGLAESAKEALRTTPDVPKIAMVGPPVSYRLEGSEGLVERGAIDLVSRIISSQKFHKAYAVTGAIATAAAALVRGSTVQETGRIEVGTGLRTIRIGHPTGAMECAVECSAVDPETVIERARVTRTARRIMEGSVFVSTPGLD